MKAFDYEIEPESASEPRRPAVAEVMARGLGWFSVGLGVAQLIAPRALSRLIGVKERPMLMRMLGLREIASGAGILTQRQPAPWLWSRVAGDAMDAAFLGAALASRKSGKKRIAGASAAVAGVVALDVWCSQQFTREAMERRAEVTSAITINRPQQELYRFWRDLRNAPKFMAHIESVQETGGNRSHWIADAPGGASPSWESEITRDVPNELIEWTSLPGSSVPHTGSVRFSPAPAGRGTEVRLKVQGLIPGQLVHEDIRRFKRLMETGEIPTTEGQPAGPSRTAVVSKFVRRLEEKGGMI